MIFEVAGVVGVDPDPYTLRELWWMAGGKWQAEFTATVAAVNWVFATPKARRQAGEINPYRGEMPEPEIVETPEMRKARRYAWLRAIRKE